jgi:ankyrin repeat protein
MSCKLLGDRSQDPILSIVSDIGMFKYLLYYGADIDTRRPQGLTVFEHACKKGDMDKIKHLVEEVGVTINIRDPKNWTPLMHACHSRELKVINYLLENGAKCNDDDLNKINSFFTDDKINSSFTDVDDLDY